MNWDYRKFPRHPVPVETFERRGKDTIILYYYYWVEPELGKGVCDIYCIPWAFPACVDQLDKYKLPTIAPSSQPRYDHVYF